MTIWDDSDLDDEGDGWGMWDRVVVVALVSTVLLTLLGFILNSLPDLPEVTW